MKEIVLDTDTLSEILKGVSTTVKEHKDAYELHFRQLTFTSVSVMEILTSYRKRGAPAQQERAVAIFRKNVEVTPDADDYRLAAEINGDLLRKERLSA